ncbi:nose resistant to fluoxetine protein 6 [Cryptotermes secundus]|nr:nose resistant to fluoxetine protein 6 [Cryptotermes secundus]
MLPLTLIDIIVCFLLGSIILLVLCGSSYDAVRRKHKCENQVKTTGGRLLMCFSLFTNFHKLGTLSKTEDSKSFRFIQGIRFLTMFLVVTTHGLFWTIRGPIQNPEWVEESYKDFFRSGFMNGNAIMGTFLSISGFLLSYFFMQDKHFRGSFSIFDFLRVIGHRYMRLTPVYAIMVALAASWFNHLGSGPMWNHIVSTETEDCRQNWWYNLLYVNNYINVDKSCLGQTWYLAVDFQCFVMSMLVLILLCKYPQFDKIILGAVMLLWILVPFLQTYIERLDPMVINYPDTLINLQQNRTFQRMYVPFHGNAGAYFVGVIFGYIYYNAKRNTVKRTRLMYVLVWSISLTVPWTFFMLSFIFYQPSYKYNVLSASFYACAYKTLFGTGIAVLVTGFALGYGWICNSIVSWKPFQVLGRLTYTIYFTHFSLQRLQAGATKQPVYLDEYSLFRSTLSDMIIAVGLALLLCLCIEMPFSAITTVFILPDLKVQTAPHKKS